jgi:U3 small nucleolar RNA-associated protein 12
LDNEFDQIRLTDESLTSYLTLNGHKGEITCISFNTKGSLMLSGSKDTDLVIWDITSETGLFRLKGHKGPLTSAFFLDSKNIIISRYVG